MSMLIHRCFTNWLNLLKFPAYWNGRCLWLKCKINNPAMVFAIGTQEKIITFLSNWVKESKLKMLTVVDFRSCLQHGCFWVATLSYQMVASLNICSSVSLSGKGRTQLGWITTDYTSFHQSNWCTIYRTF